MTKTHYINPRYYQNERTILFNPSKPFTKIRKKPRKTGFLRYLLFVLIIFSAFISYSAFAGGPIPDEGWVTETDKDFVTIRHHGNITHGDDIIVLLNKGDCSSAIWLSRIYTEANPDFSPILEKSLPYKLQNLSDESDHGYTTAQLISVRPFLRGHSAIVYFGEYPINKYLKWFRSGDEYQMEIIKAGKDFIEKEYGDIDEDIVSIEPTDFFDIQMNSYYFEDFNKTLIAAQKQCHDLSVVLLS